MSITHQPPAPFGHFGTSHKDEDCGPPDCEPKHHHHHHHDHHCPTPCFAAGTTIQTARGDVPVEALRIGDWVVTSSGATRPIKWLGHRTVDCSHHPRPDDVNPVRIAAHAFGEKRPTRDLCVSPGHAICVDVVSEILIPARSLVNGATIRRVAVETVTYWHVELDAHDILLAEGLPAESYLDMDNRGFFEEAELVDLTAAPDPVRRTPADFCRPFHVGGTLVEAVRAQLSERAECLGWRLEEAPHADLHLLADGVRVEPVRRDLSARFAVPAGAGELRLVSSTIRPSDMSATTDGRELGVCLAAIRIEDGFGGERLGVDDPRLGEGCHPVEDGCRRWTTGSVRLPGDLAAAHTDGFYLCVDLAGPALPRWVVPDNLTTGEAAPVAA